MRLPAIPVYLTLAVAGSFLFALYGTLSAIYRIQAGGLDPLELVLVGTALEGSVFLFEIPTGVVADVYSRRLSIIIGMAVIGVGFVVESLWPAFAPILAARVIWGVGYTFTSGARSAWIVDEVGAERMGDVFLRGAQLGQAGALAGIGASVALASVDLYLPLLVAGIGYIALAAFLALTMPERGFRRRPREERQSWRSFAGTLSSGVGVVRGRPTLLWLLAIALLVGVASEPLDRLWELHLLEQFTFPALLGATPVVWFGAVQAGSLVGGIAVVAGMRRTLNLDDPGVAARALLWLNAVLVVSIAGFALAPSFSLALAGFCVLSIARRLEGPVASTWINQQIPSEVRATVLSMNTQADSLGQFTGGPALGALARGAGVRAALLATAALLVPAQGLYLAARRSAGTRRRELG